MYILAKGNTFKHKRAIVEEIHKQKAEYDLSFMGIWLMNSEHNVANSCKTRWRLVVSSLRLLVRDDRTEFLRREMLSERMRLMFLQRRSKWRQTDVEFAFDLVKYILHSVEIRSDG